MDTGELLLQLLTATLGTFFLVQIVLSYRFVNVKAMPAFLADKLVIRHERTPWNRYTIVSAKTYFTR